MRGTLRGGRFEDYERETSRRSEEGGDTFNKRESQGLTLPTPLKLCVLFGRSLISPLWKLDSAGSHPFAHLHQWAVSWGGLLNENFEYSEEWSILPLPSSFYFRFKSKKSHLRWKKKKRIWIGLVGGYESRGVHSILFSYWQRKFTVF